MTDTVLRCENAADLIAALPQLTGFTDQHSVFVMLFRGSRAHRVLRFALPESDTKRAGELLASGIIDMLRDSGAGKAGPAVIIHTAQAFSTLDEHPWHRFTECFSEQIRGEGWTLREFALVAADGWCTLSPKHTAKKRSLTELNRDPLGSQGTKTPTPAGAPLVASFPTLASLSAPAARESERAAAIESCLQRMSQHRARIDTPPDESRALQQTRRIARAAERCFRAQADSQSGTPAEPAEVARLIHAAQHSGSWLIIALTALTSAECIASVAAEFGAVRLSTIAPLEEAAPAKTAPMEAAPMEAAPLEAAPLEAAPQWSIEGLLRALASELPDRARLRNVIDACKDAAAHAPAHFQAPVIALLAWAWWLLGMQSVAVAVLAPVVSGPQQKTAPAAEAGTPATEAADAGPAAARQTAAADLALLVQRLIALPPEAHLQQLSREFATPAKQAA